jgi:hypothetical protein
VGTAAPVTGVPDLFQKAAPSKRAEAVSYGGQVEQMRGTTIDPEAVARATIESPEFRIASRLTAESEQMLAREGPLWESMSKSITGPIIEGSAAFMSEQSEKLRREFARGGAARNRSRQAMQEIRVAEQVNKTRQTNLWNSSLALNQWARDNARTQLTFNQGWASNVAGVRDSFHDALDKAGQFMVEVAIPGSRSASLGADAISRIQHEQNRAKIKRIGSFAVGAIATVAGLGLGMPSIAGMGLKAMGQAAVGPSEGISAYPDEGLGELAQTAVGKIGSLTGRLFGGGEEEAAAQPDITQPTAAMIRRGEPLTR